MHRFSRRPMRALGRWLLALPVLLAGGGLMAHLPARAQEADVVVQAMGDIMLAGRWAEDLKRQGFATLFSGVSAELARGQLNVANLEAPIAQGGTEHTGKQFRFRADPAVAPALRAAGLHAVSLANNHTMDFGAEALLETMQHLHRSGLGWFGGGRHLALARQPLLVNLPVPGSRRGRDVALLGYSTTEPTSFFATATRAGIAPAHEALMLADVRAAREVADHVIVNLHWGTESESSLQPHQQPLAHRLIDAGADVVIGHHPHVLRGIERYKNRLIFYSLGNFVFASRGSAADEGMIVRLHLRRSGGQAEIIPLDVLARRVGFTPQVLTGERGRAVINRLNQLSQPLQTQIRSSADGRHWLDFTAPAPPLARKGSP